EENRIPCNVRRDAVTYGRKEHAKYLRAIYGFLLGEIYCSFAHNCYRMPCLEARVGDFLQPHIPRIDAVPNKSNVHQDYFLCERGVELKYVLAVLVATIAALNDFPGRSGQVLGGALVLKRLHSNRSEICRT